MEPPEHDKWEPKQNIEKGEKIISEITMFIRDCLNKLKENQTYETLEIPELQKYLPYDKEGEEMEMEMMVTAEAIQEMKVKLKLLI